MDRKTEQVDTKTMPTISNHENRGILGESMARVFLDVDPKTLRLPSTRRSGADPVKLQRQIAKHGKSVQGMPPLFAYEATDGELILSDGVTRATRVAKLLPGTLVPVEIVGQMNIPGASAPTVGDKLP